MRGIPRIELIGVEAGQSELSNLRTHFGDNGLDPDQHTIIHAAIDDHDAPAAPDNPGGAPLLSLKTLLSGRGVIDLIHCDIQFAESRAFKAGIGAVTKQVKRVVVGTHSRRIEDDLMTTFIDAGWDLEWEVPCRYSIINGRPVLMVDGVQVWKNTRLGAEDPQEAPQPPQTITPRSAEPQGLFRRIAAAVRRTGTSRA